MRPATALVELIDDAGGVVASNIAPIQAVIDGADVVLLIECMIRSERAFAMIAQRISAGRQEVEFRWPQVVNVKPSDTIMISSRVETTQWQGVSADLKGLDGTRQRLQLSQPSPVIPAITPPVAVKYSKPRRWLW